MREESAWWIEDAKRCLTKTGKYLELGFYKELKDFLSLISPYYFITRYPDIATGLPSEIITETFAKECLTKTRRFFDCFQKFTSKEK
ncbi:MAG: HEPN domain-containing protein [Candidatus Bathyarchaeia archaeon]